jgi:hypothetical protein
MKRIVFLYLSISSIFLTLSAQTLIPIPQTLEGSSIDLYIKDTSNVFFKVLTRIP